MADYSSQATTLGGTQGAQASGGVQTQFVDTNGPLESAIGMGADIFSGFMKDSAKKQAMDAESQVVSSYVKTENMIADALRTGQITASVASARSKANFAQNAAANPLYIDKIKSAGEALKGFADLGDVQQQMKDAAENQKKLVQDAQQRGFVIPAGAPQTLIDSQVSAYQAGIRADENMRRTIQANTEARAAAGEGRQISAEQRTIEDRTRKESSLTMINEIAGSNIDSFNTFGKYLATEVASGKMTTEQAQQHLVQQYSHINSGIQAAASLNPELANGYKSSFKDMYDVFSKQLDPKTRVENINAQVDGIVANGKLIALSNNPKFAAGVSVSALFGNSPQVAFAMSGEALNAVTQIANATTTNGAIAGYVPQVVGVPDVEKSTLDLLKSSVGKLSSPSVQKKDILAIQTNNSANVILKQVGDLLDKGVDPASLKDLATFFASSEYGILATGGKLDKQAAQAAYKTFGITYEPVIINGVQEKMKNLLYSNTASFTGSQGTPKPLLDNIEVSFTGSGIVFNPKAGGDLSKAEASDRKEQLASLNSSQKAINQLIHIGAHMEGSTDYAAFWEANKHRWMPTLFSKYSNIPMGMIKDGPEGKMRFIGPDNDDKGWVKVQ